MFESSELHLSDRQPDEGAAYEAGCKCAQETVDKLNNSLQHLQAKISTIVDRLQRAYAMRESPDVLDCISELRQLSAVQ